MSKYFFKNFHSILDNMKDTKYFYECRDDYCHVIGYTFTIDDNSMSILSVIEKMKTNKILPLLKKDDYSWDGASISFREKNHAAMFYMYI